MSAELASGSWFRPVQHIRSGKRDGQGWQSFLENELFSGPSNIKLIATRHLLAGSERSGGQLETKVGSVLSHTAVLIMCSVSGDVVETTFMCA